MLCALTHFDGFSREGTQRRPQKKTPHNAQASVQEDKKLKAAIKKFGK